MVAQESLIWPGNSYPLGATFDGVGTNFALFSEVADRVELCLFNEDGAETRVSLNEVDGFVWHGYLPGVSPGQQARLPGGTGPYDPAAGQRCNPNKLLLDPYAKAIDGSVQWDQAVFAYPFGHPDQRNDEDSAPHARSVVINPFFSWDSTGTRGPPTTRPHLRRTWAEQLPEVPEAQRGTTGWPLVIDHLPVRLGITAVELMPVHQFVSDAFLAERGLPITGATTPSASSPRTTRMQRPGTPASRCPSSSPWSTPARGGHRGHSRRGLQPHRRGQPSGPDAVASGASTTRPTTG